MPIVKASKTFMSEGRKAALSLERRVKVSRVDGPKVVWVGYSDGKPHLDHNAQKTRQSGYTVCSTEKAAKSMYEDARPMLLIPLNKLEK